ncbi:MAG TPA: hypothetical protein VLT32_03080 [Candidatus Sulfomarinibacteraceae bacterium]|nr:hypothetical protein [Candidatus Sulfomarinibacteraceae bacterium]
MQRGLLTGVLVLVVAGLAFAGDELDIYNPDEVGVSNPAPLTLWEWPSPDVVLYDNGPLVTHPAGGAGGADASALQTTLGMNTLGAGHQNNLGYSLADEFTVTDAAGWQIDTITFFAYQTGSTTTSTITGVYVAIWDAAPNAGGTVIWGDQTTNRLLTTGWSNIYRVTDTTLTTTNRPIMENVATIGTTLAQGTYWLQWSAAGSLSSGPWAPPISVLGQTTTGNALQYTTAWAALTDTGTLTPQGMPFIINGSVVPVELQSFSIE